jgi:hypothetical protein
MICRSLSGHNSTMDKGAVAGRYDACTITSPQTTWNSAIKFVDQTRAPCQVLEACRVLALWSTRKRARDTTNEHSPRNCPIRGINVLVTKGTRDSAIRIFKRQVHTYEVLSFPLTAVSSARLVFDENDWIRAANADVLVHTTSGL